MLTSGEPRRFPGSPRAALSACADAQGMTSTAFALRGRTRAAARSRARSLPRPEMLLLLAVAGVLNLWGLSRNGWANDYYAGAVRAMSHSWHAFLYGSRSEERRVGKECRSRWRA